MKACSKCKVVKPLGEFHRRGDRPHRDSWCRACKSEKRRAYYARNRERCLAEAKAAYAARKDDPAHRAANAAKAKAYREANPERARAAVRTWAKRYPERVRASSAKKKAARRAAHVEHVDALVVLERDDGECGICGGDVDPFDHHVDHVVPIARGGLHNYANAQAAHPLCNARKKARLQEELQEEAARYERTLGAAVRARVAR